MSETRDCPNCEQGKHQICNEQVLVDGVPLIPGQMYALLMDDEQWVPCPCAERGHKADSRAGIVDEATYFEETGKLFPPGVTHRDQLAEEP